MVRPLFITFGEDLASDTQGHRAAIVPDNCVISVNCHTLAPSSFQYSSSWQAGCETLREIEQLLTIIISS